MDRGILLGPSASPFTTKPHTTRSNCQADFSRIQLGFGSSQPEHRQPEQQDPFPADYGQGYPRTAASGQVTAACSSNSFSMASVL